MTDYNEPTLENIMRLVKDLHNKMIEWIECDTCGKKMQDKGFTTCYTCNQSKKGQGSTPTSNFTNDF